MADNPIRVLHVISSMTNGGAENYIMNQYRNIDRNKVQFDFLTSRPGNHVFNDEILQLGGKIYVIKPPSEQGALGFVKDIVRILKNDRSIKAIHSHTLFNCGLAMLAGFMAGIKIRISHSHNTSAKKHNNRLKRIVYTVSMRILIKLLSTKYFACGNEAGKFLFGKRFLQSKKSKLIPNSIDIKKFNTVNKEQENLLRQSLNIPDGIPVYTNIGRFAAQKNKGFCLKIASYLKKSGHDFRMLLIGDGKLFDEIKQQTAELELDDCVIILPPRPDIPQILSITDVFILPSLYEGLPVTIIEAQAACVPCICSEHVTTQVDIGMNLIKFIGITDNDIKKWAEECIKSGMQKDFDRNAVFERLKELGYESATGAQYLCDIYSGVK